MSGRWRSSLVLAIVAALLAAGCGSAAQPAAPEGAGTAPRRLHSAPGGGYVSGSTHDFGSGGP